MYTILHDNTLNIRKKCINISCKNIQIHIHAIAYDLFTLDISYQVWIEYNFVSSIEKIIYKEFIVSVYFFWKRTYFVPNQYQYNPEIHYGARLYLIYPSCLYELWCDTDLFTNFIHMHMHSSTFPQLLIVWIV